MNEYDVIKNRMNELAQLILDTMYADEPFDNKEREEKSLKDVRWTLTYIIEGFRVKNKGIVENLFVWMKRLFRGLKIAESHVDLLFVTTKRVLHEEIQSHPLDDFLESIDVKDTVPEQKAIHNPFQTEKDAFLDALLTSDRQKAHQLVYEMLDKDVALSDIYLYIFQEVMRDIGNLWHDGIIPVGREHYATAVTQYLMSTLYSRMFTSQRRDKSMVACAVGSELHEMGIRMVADLFELNGWDTYYLGPNLPAEEIVGFALKQQPDVIALSITMPYHMSRLQETISAIRQEEALDDVKILVGGLPFLHDETLYQTVGADAYAVNAMEGIDIANQLIQ